jgi:hypothetical protein
MASIRLSKTMLVLEAKLKGKTAQYALIDEAICTALFCRNNRFAGSEFLSD